MEVRSRFESTTCRKVWKQKWFKDDTMLEDEPYLDVVRSTSYMAHDGQFIAHNQVIIHSNCYSEVPDKTRGTIQEVFKHLDVDLHTFSVAANTQAVATEDKSSNDHRCVDSGQARVLPGKVCMSNLHTIIAIQTQHKYCQRSPETLVKCLQFAFPRPMPYLSFGESVPAKAGKDHTALAEVFGQLLHDHGHNPLKTGQDEERQYI